MIAVALDDYLEGVVEGAYLTRRGFKAKLDLINRCLASVGAPPSEFDLDDYESLVEASKRRSSES